MTHHERAQELLAEIDAGIDAKAMELPFNGDFKHLEALIEGYRSYILTMLEQLISEGRIE